MSRKEMVSAKIGGKTFDRLERYADEEEISRSQAVDRMVKQGLDVEESDMRLVPVKTDGGTEIEEKLDETDRKIQKLLNSGDQVARDRLNALSLIALIYIGAELSFGLPVWATLSAGTVLGFGLIWTWVSVYV